MSEFKKRLSKAITKAETRVTHDGSFYGAGLATEGYDGGYMAALCDVDAVITHGYPSDRRGVWSPDLPPSKGEKP